MSEPWPLITVPKFCGECGTDFDGPALTPAQPGAPRRLGVCPKCAATRRPEFTVPAKPDPLRPPNKRAAQYDPDRFHESKTPEEE